MMKPMKYLALLLITCIFACNNFNIPDSYYDDYGFFAYAKGTDDKKATLLLKKSKYGYKYETTKRVMEDLIAAKGVKGMATPSLIMTNAERRIAFAKPSEALIGLEEKAYDVCASFGKDSLNALAALLGHELTHYYEKHDWKNQFAKDFGNKISTKDAAADKLDIETEADYLGGFLAFQAGYNTLGIMPEFLDKVYAAYKFPEALEGYPSLTERKELANKSLKKLEDLIHAFEMANYLVALQDYENAKKYYEYIVITENYQSREMYNNLGVTATLYAMEFFLENELKYIYPVELDLESRLGPQTRGLGDDLEKARNILLNEAIAHFKNAQSLDPNYVPAILNLGCAYALQADFFEADYHARKALSFGKKQKNKKLISDANVLLGIIQARQNENADALASFDKAIKANNRLGTLNKNILNGEENPLPNEPKNALAAPEKIDNLSLDEMVSDLMMGGLNPDQQFEISKRATLAMTDKGSSKILINFMAFDEVYHIFHTTNADFTGKTKRGIGINDPLEKVMANENYGNPTYLINTTNGLFLVYYGHRIIFEMNENNQVRRWILFREQRKNDN